MSASLKLTHHLATSSRASSNACSTARRIASNSIKVPRNQGSTILLVISVLARRRDLRNTYRSTSYFVPIRLAQLFFQTPLRRLPIRFDAPVFLQPRSRQRKPQLATVSPLVRPQPALTAQMRQSPGEGR